MAYKGDGKRAGTGKRDDSEDRMRSGIAGV